MSNNTQTQRARIQAGVVMDRRLWQRVKMQALREDRTAAALVEDAMKAYLKNAQQARHGEAEG